MEQQTLFKIRDCRKKDQYKIDDQYLNGYAKIFGTITTAVYNSLSRHAEFHTQEAFPSEELIAEEHGISKKSVQRAIKQLKGANIIKVDRMRRGGKWLNNLYFLIDKTEWIKPEDIKDLWRTKRHFRPKPEDIKDATRGQQDPIKDNTLGRITHIKEASASADANLNDIISLFKAVNPSYEKLYANKTQRSALERMIKKHGEEKIIATIKALPQIINKTYAPKITTPFELERDLGKLIAFYNQEKNKVASKKLTTII